MDIYFEADECFPDKLFDVRLAVGTNVVDSVKVNYTKERSVDSYIITLKKGNSILWPHGYEGQIVIDSLEFKSPSFKNFLINLGVISLHKWFPDQEEGVPDYFETRLGNILDKSRWSRWFTFYFYDMRDFNLALDILHELKKHQEIDRADIEIGGGAYY